MFLLCYTFRFSLFILVVRVSQYCNHSYLWQQLVYVYPMVLDLLVLTHNMEIDDEHVLNGPDPSRLHIWINRDQMVACSMYL